MKLKVITPERIVLEEDGIEALYARTVDGEVGILPKHIPMVASLDVGVLRFVKDGRKQPLAVMGGLLRTNGEEISVLSDAAERAEEIDVVRAQHAKEQAEAQLRQHENNVDTERVQAALSRSLVRLKAKNYTAG